MAPDLRPGSENPPTDELAAAEAGLAVLEQVLRGVTGDDLSNPTPCSQFDVAQLTDHLMNSITVLGGAAGAELPERDTADTPAGQVRAAARPALDAWQARGLDGTIAFGPNELPAKAAVGILALEFLVHAWDYATATGRTLEAPEPLAQYVLDRTQQILTPAGRATAGFDPPVEVADSAPALDRLIAFTGRS
ncbi:TIGR03086 family metal-binding protein [[Mycobacterium] vasticus]|uniref:TIGR03086 family metal-binding protein n=1 Tax=[Mycobacterium] vasticus TaxID=2875777 RepID=A0ABU5YZM3_9MYCO|nr:TIGR03086 family metal-binding protein [Mycolicibacter sp. MYC017]MEB3070601.1 TIGR03086 family metal-binding protein [Mycolicibacter sp. MYC017]